MNWKVSLIAFTLSCGGWAKTLDQLNPNYIGLNSSWNAAQNRQDEAVQAKKNADTKLKEAEASKDPQQINSAQAEYDKAEKEEKEATARKLKLDEQLSQTNNSLETLLENQDRLTQSNAEKLANDIQLGRGSATPRTSGKENFDSDISEGNYKLGSYQSGTGSRSVTGEAAKGTYTKVGDSSTFTDSAGKTYSYGGSTKLDGGKTAYQYGPYTFIKDSAGNVSTFSSQSLAQEVSVQASGGYSTLSTIFTDIYRK